MEVVIITGMSGAGRSRAADWFEDQGYYCVDNMPPVLINNFLAMASSAENNIEKAVFVHQNIEFGHIVKFGIHHIIVCSYLNLLMIAAEHG